MSQKIIKVYIENSVIGGYFDVEFMEQTRQLFQLFHNGNLYPVISYHVIKELNDGAPQEVIDILSTIKYDIIKVTKEMEQLADKYIEQGVVSENFRDDALHIAIATLSDVQLLVSWNFRHIVNYRRIRLFNSVNIAEGYTLLEIRSPRELIENE